MVPSGGGGFTAWGQPVSAPYGRCRLIRRKDLQVGKEPQKLFSFSSYSNLPAQVKFQDMKTKQQSRNLPLFCSGSGCFLTAFRRGPSIPGRIVMLPGHGANAWQFPSDLNFSCGNSYMRHWSSKSSRFSAPSLP